VAELTKTRQIGFYAAVWPYKRPKSRARLHFPDFGLKIAPEIAAGARQRLFPASRNGDVSSIVGPARTRQIEFYASFISRAIKDLRKLGMFRRSKRPPRRADPSLSSTYAIAFSRRQAACRRGFAAPKKMIFFADCC
jgi:hypothetical protein